MGCSSGAESLEAGGPGFHSQQRKQGFYIDEDLVRAYIETLFQKLCSHTFENIKS